MSLSTLIRRQQQPDDPKAYRKPWTVKTGFVLRPDTELLESSCEGHDRTMEHRRIDDLTHPRNIPLVVPISE